MSTDVPFENLIFLRRKNERELLTFMQTTILLYFWNEQFFIIISKVRKSFYFQFRNCKDLKARTLKFKFSYLEGIANW